MDNDCVNSNSANAHSVSGFYESKTSLNSPLSAEPLPGDAKNELSPFVASEAELFNLALSDHQVDRSLKERRQDWTLLWKEERIVDCTVNSAVLVLIYSTLGRRYQKEIIGSGRCLFFWDRNDQFFLNLKRLEGNKTIDYRIEISPEGLLLYDDTFYKNPAEFLESLTLKTHIVHHCIDIVAGTPLDCTLKRNFDANCQLFYPPEYPPLLVHIAMNNFDYATAAAILRHPFLDDPAIPRNKNFRLQHLVEQALSNAIADGHPTMLGYLLNEYDVLLEHTYPFKMAVLSKKQNMAEYILKILPQNMRSQAFAEAFLAAVEAGDLKIFNWLLEVLPQEIATLASVESPRFLALLFEKFGLDAFEDLVKRLHINLSDEVLLPEFIKANRHPLSYLHFFLQDGRLPELSIDLKINLVLQLLTFEETSNEVQAFFNEFLNPADQLPVLKKALFFALPNLNKVELILELGVVPSKEHFEALLKIDDGSENAKKVFMALLGAIPDIHWAKSNLSIGSAFGAEAVKAIFEKFPDLSGDQEFLALFLADMWKGTVVSTDRLLSEMLSVGKAATVTPELPKGSSLNPIIPTLDREISTDVLVEVFLPSHQINKISSTLMHKPECIYDFWWKSIFSGYSDFEGSQWEKIAELTFSPQYLTNHEREKLISKAIQYSHLQLASLWLKQMESAPASAIFEWFDEALKSLNAGIVPLLAEYKLLDPINDAGESLLHLAVKNNAIDVASGLLQNGLNPFLKDHAGLTPYNWALTHHYLSLCLLLGGKECLDEITGMILALSPPDADQWLFTAYLNSECDDVHELLLHLNSKVENDFSLSKEEKSVLIHVFLQLEAFMQTCGSFIVRFPSPVLQKEVHGGYGKGYASYQQQQRSWGEECEKYYQNFLETYQNQDHVILEVFMKLAGVTPKVDYEAWRMGVNAGLVTHFYGRYFMFWQYAQKMYKELLKDPEKYYNALLRVDEGYQVLYKLDDSTVVPLSTLQIRKPIKQGNFQARMNHTGPIEVKLLLPHLNILFEEIKNFSLPAERPIAPPAELKKMIAKLFWLGCHLTPTARGSSQYMLMFHRLLYNIHGYTTRSWSLKYVQPDCMAILMPFEVFYHDYYGDLY